MRPVCVAVALVLFGCVQPPLAQVPDTSGPVLEIRSYNLRPGVRDDFHRRFERESLPLLARMQVDVVAYGPSQHDADSYFLMRAFASAEARQRAEDAFYGSPEWLNGPRAAVLAAIESYATVVIHVDDATLKGLRHTMTSHDTAADLAEVTRLNGQYIEGAKTASAEIFERILAGDFLCTLPDGTLLDRAAFITRTRNGPPVPGLRAEDVRVRLFGDVAIVHAATAFQQADGTEGHGRYTDVWARQNGQWLAVAAQFLRK